MKTQKLFLGAFVGGIILFFWQFLSHTVLNLHAPAEQYTPAQEQLLAELSKHLSKPGGYMLPRLETNTMEYPADFVQKFQGKPWATIQYHPSLSMDMSYNIIREFILDVVLVFLFLLVLRRLKNQSPGQIIFLCLLLGFLIFSNSSYSYHIWYPRYDLRADLIDYVVSWGLCGLFLALYLPEKRRVL